MASNALAHDYKMTVMLKPHSMVKWFYTETLTLLLMPNGKMGG
jgi:hypothetical protein